MRHSVIAACLVLFAAAVQAQSFELNKGDHVAIVGNTLADRMQHHGWLETLLVSRFPQHELVFRNLGFSGDEITTRLRSDNFGSPDEWLTKVKADVIFAFFGFNESFAGEAGLAKFKQDLDAWIKHTLAQKYNGESAPRLVLFSPIAHEDLDDPNLDDGRQNNKRLKVYAAAMAEVAHANSVLFVDLFAPTSTLYADDAKPLTFNGIHLTEYGDLGLAVVIERALFPGGEQIKRDAALLDRLRKAINEKNFQWHARYRTVDGYNVYGGRSQEAYESGVGGPKVKNFLVMQEEMTQRDVMTANRDKRVWAVAQGGDLTVDDSNLPPVTQIGPNRDNLSPYIDAEAAIKRMTVAKGCVVNLFASEEQFPELISPVQMAWDTKGRLWVAAWKTYPERMPTEKIGDSLLVLEDTNGDGRADKCTPFLDDLNCPTGFQFFKDGVLVMQAPNLWFARDTDGDGRADWKEDVLMGIDSADSHHTTNAMVLDPGGATYLSDGVFHRTQVETAMGVVRNNDGCIFRYEPLTQRFERYVSYGFANPHGRVFDRWGNDIITDATGNANYFAPAFSGFVEYPGKHAGMNQFWDRPSRPCPGTGMVSSRHFPDDWQGNFLNCNVIGFQGIFRVKVTEDGSGLKGETLEDLVKSDDPNFRPSAVGCAPDGSIYFLDWHKQLIGHLQHHIRDPNRDKSHGRIYRITYEDRPLLTPPQIHGQSILALLDLLKSPEDDVRTRAKIELGKHDSAEVTALAHAWAANLDKRDPDFEHHQTEALWVHQWHNVVNMELLKRVLASPDHRARAAATRVLCYWRDRIPTTLDLLKQLAADSHPRVRLEAVRAASFFTVPEAVEVPLIAAEHPLDYYLTYTSGETMKTLEPHWKKAVAENQTVNVTTAAGARFFLGHMSLEQLLKLDRTRPVYQELLFRPGLTDEQRREAITGLAQLDKQSELAVLLDAIRSIDNQQQSGDQSVVFDLMRLLAGRGAGDLAESRDELEKLALTAKQAVIRQVAYVAMVSVDGSADEAWALANKSPAALRDFLTAVPLIADPGLRASLYDRIEPLLSGLPDSLGGESAAKGTYGRFVRIELPRRGTLTLAEVEVYGEGRNVARGGKATQKNAAHGGEASRGIDGNTNPSYGGGGQTHTEENTEAPWWEVDLGEELPIDSVVIYNRVDGDLGQRLKGFTLKVLDAGRNEVFRRDDNPAPSPQTAFEVGGGGPAALVRRAAMNALVSVRGQEVRTFGLLAKFIVDDIDRLAAIRAIQRLPQSTWPKDQAEPVLVSLIGYVAKFPVADRTSPAALDGLQLADALASLLPAEQAKAYRAQLRELGVRVIRLGTLPERMSYDQEVLVVQAGKPVEFLLENTDLMPHNFVIAQIGAMEEIGQIAEASAQQPEFARRHFVPQSTKVLAASVLLQPRQMQKLSFVAPTQPGVYPYVCTYPGHWRRMHGALYVVPDLDAYLENPDAYLASAKIAPVDPLLKDRRPRTEWNLDDLADAVAHLEGRNYAAARQMFTVASCVACHKLDGQGNQFGPDLSQLDAKLQPLDLIKEMLDPSAKINEKFQTQVFQLESGVTVTGLVVEETPTTIKLIENPLVKAEPIEIKVEEIAARKKSPLSIMPKGLLDKLTRDEILDLVAYIAARGKKDHPLFKAGGHGHHHGH